MFLQKIFWNDIFCSRHKGLVWKGIEPEKIFYPQKQWINWKKETEKTSTYKNSAISAYSWMLCMINKGYSFLFTRGLRDSVQRYEGWVFQPYIKKWETSVASGLCFVNWIVGVWPGLVWSAGRDCQACTTHQPWSAHNLIRIIFHKSSWRWCWCNHSVCGEDSDLLRFCIGRKCIHGL